MIILLIISFADYRNIYLHIGGTEIAEKSPRMELPGSAIFRHQLCWQAEMYGKLRAAFRSVH